MLGMVVNQGVVEQSSFVATSSEFEVLFERLYEPQVRRAFLLVGSMALAHDLVSEAFTAVHRRWDDLDQPERYLKRCVLNRCRDWGRSRSRWSRLVVEGFDQAALEQVRDASVSFDQVDLADALARLSYRQRAAIVLQFYGNESQESIADLLGCRRGTVGSLLHRGLRFRLISQNIPSHSRGPGFDSCP